VEDTTLAQLFLEKQDELNLKLTALRELDSPKFLYSSLQLYGEVDEGLYETAKQVMDHLKNSESEELKDPLLDVAEVVLHAREEVAWYRAKMAEFNPSVEVSDTIASGMMVSHDRLLISASLRVRRGRLHPLLDHEIGTHLLTYFNGLKQNLRQLFAGLAGCEEMQEGMAVFAEYLAGGLSFHRLRTLAARVIAVRSKTAGATFVETFEHLHEGWGIDPFRAFTTTVRVFRGGGFTKDLIYLRGLIKFLKHLEQGHDIEPFYVGKIGILHIPYVQELRRRGIVHAPSLLPRSWEDPRTRKKIEKCRGKTLMNLIEESAP
jgi:uncharacterized protein (TIGR02421 family)